MIFNMFQEDAKLVSNILALLNEHTEELTGKYTYLHVELREGVSNIKIGEFSDEIGPDAWYYQPVDVHTDPMHGTTI